MANLLSATTIGDSQVLSVGNMTSHGVITTSTIGSQSVSYAGSAGYTPTISLTSLGSGSVNVNNGSSAVYRTETGNGAAVAYAPLLHLGGGDTMWQIQGTYGTSGDGILYFRQGYSGSWGNWLTMLSNSNYNSYSPTLTGGGASGTWGISISGNSAYASSAGNADTVDGYHANNAAGGIAVINANGYWYPPSWINVGGAGIYSGTNNAHLLPNGTSPHGAWEMIGSRGGWSGIYFRDSGNTIMANANDSGFYNANAGWQIEWYNGTLYCSKSANGGGTQATVLDSSNFTSWAQEKENQRLSTGNSPTFQEVYANGWFRTTGYQGLYNPTNSAHFYPNDYSYGAWRIVGTRNGWNGLHFGGGNGITLMMNEGEFGFHREAVGWVARFTSGYFHGTSSAADSVAWGNVSGRPTALSQFTNDSGYITSSGRAYPRRSDGGDLNFYWSGQGGQPTWLWGGNDGANMYVYNPSNFSVSYASSAGYVPGGVKFNEWYGNIYIGSGGDIYGTIFYDTNDSYWRLDPSDYSRYNTADINRIHNYGWYTNSQWGDSAMLCIGGDFDPSYPIQIETERWGAALYTNKGALWALDFIGSSDIRYKTNIANISNGLGVISSLQPVTYNRIDDSSQKTKAGLIAQEVESVLPHVVSSTIEPETLNEVLGVDYVQLVPYLISAIKQQQQQIEDLTNRISQLEQ